MSDMSEMSVQEAYRVLQANCGIEAGDKVKVLRAAKTSEMGWGYGWDKKYSKHIGDIGVVDRITPNDNGFYIVFAHDNIYAPFFVLELVEKAKPELPSIVIAGSKVEFHDDHIRVCGIMVPNATLRNILERLEN